MGRDIKTKFNAFVLIGILMLASGIASVWLADIYLSDTQNTYSTKITNSKGGVWNATEAGLQDAIDSLANASGSVYIPSMITITNSIRVGNYCTLYSYGSGGLTQGNSNNKTLLRNYTVSGTAYKHNITIKGLRFEGNGLNQVEGTPNYADEYANGMTFIRVRYLKIENCYINNTVGAGVLTIFCNYSSVEQCTLTNIGSPYEGTAKATSHPAGIYVVSSFYFVVSKNHIRNCYSDGVTGEVWNRFGTSRNNYPSKYVLIDGNVISHCSFGIYIERVNNFTITNNIITNIDKIEAYAGTTGGIRLGSATTAQNVNDTIVSNNIIRDVSSMLGIYADGYRNSIIGNTILRVNTYGIWCGVGSDTIISNNEIRNSAIGIQCNHYDSIITSNRIHTSATYAIAYGPTVNSSNHGTTISNNVIDECRGIYIYGYFISITGNTLYNCADWGIRLVGVQNCTISSNTIRTVTNSGADGIGISTGSRNITVTSNIISGAVDAGISLDYCKYSVIGFNRISGCAVGTKEVSALCNFNLYIGNIIMQNTADTIHIHGANDNTTCNIATIT